jgi:hypothetical protein
VKEILDAIRAFLTVVFWMLLLLGLLCLLEMGTALIFGR